MNIHPAVWLTPVAAGLPRFVTWLIGCFGPTTETIMSTTTSKLDIKGTIEAGKLGSQNFDFLLDVNDLDIKEHIGSGVTAEILENGKNGVVVELTAFSILKVKRTILTPGAHAFHVSLGVVSASGTITLSE